MDLGRTKPEMDSGEETPKGITAVANRRATVNR